MYEDNMSCVFTPWDYNEGHKIAEFILYSSPRACMHAYIHIHIHINIHTHIRTYTHTYMHTYMILEQTKLGDCTS